MNGYQIGDHVIYHFQKVSTHPGPRAREVWPTEHGDVYTYVVDKYWTIWAVHEDEVEVVTRRGKIRRLSVDDPLLRKAGWLDEILHHQKFPTMNAVAGAA